MPFDVIGQDTQEDMRTDALCLVMVNRPHQDIDALQRPKEPFHDSQVFIAAHGVLGRETLGGLAEMVEEQARAFVSEHLGPGWREVQERIRQEAAELGWLNAPVLAQETGFSQFLPTGEGLFPFQTIEDILSSLEMLNRDYPRHSRAARALAEEFFDSDKVLVRLLQHIGAVP